MTPPNPYLEQFLANSRRARNEIAESADLVKLIEEKLGIQQAHCGFYSEESWNTGNQGAFIPLIPGKYGLKKKSLDSAITEITVHADIYSPELEISPFAVIYDEIDTEEGRKLIYVVKDFGNLPVIHQNCKNFLPIRNAIRYMISRGYGTPGKSVTSVDDFIDFDFRGHQLWENIFLYNGINKWAMVDLDCNCLLINSDEIHDGAIFGEGRFARLHDIWQRMNTGEYRIK